MEAAGLSTERLTLRPIALTDLDFIVRINTDPELMRHIHAGVPRSVEESTEHVHRAVAAWSETGRGSFVLHTHTGVPVGTVSIGPLDWLPEFMPGWDLGWTIVQEHQRNGYATEAARALIQWFFATGDTTRVYGVHNTENPKSRGVMERLGLRHVGRRQHPEFDFTIEIWETTASEFGCGES
jgi:RimJ/RimL family protein N-acetyltransferase